MHISSRCTKIFWPNPPPVSRAMARTRCSGMPSSRAQKARCSCGAWVATHIVISSVPALVLDDDAAGLDRHRGVRLLVDGHLDDVGGRREDRLQHRRRRAVVVDDVAPVAPRAPTRRRRPRRGSRRPAAGGRVDDHELARVLGDVAVLGDDERDGIADEADLALGERRSRRLRRRRAELGVPLLVHTRVEVLGDEHRPDAGQGQGLGHVDRRRSGPGRRGCARSRRGACPAATTSSTKVPRPRRRRASSTRCTRLPV